MFEILGSTLINIVGRKAFLSCVFLKKKGISRSCLSG